MATYIAASYMLYVQEVEIVVVAICADISVYIDISI